MDIIVVLALVVAFIMCLLPGVMAWSHYVSRNRQSPARKQSAAKRQLQPAPLASK